MSLTDGKYYPAGESQLYAGIEGSGNNSVIIEPGLAVLSVEWLNIAKELTDKSTVVLYDRAGYGKSPRGKLPRTSEQVADDLFCLLNNLDIPKPYIFISHSAGGLYSRHFTQKYPEVAGGIVFVDTLTVDFMEFENLNLPTYQQHLSVKARINKMQQYTDMSEIEFDDKINSFLKFYYKDYPIEIKEKLIKFQSCSQYYQTAIDELTGIIESPDLIENSGQFPPIPIKILVRDKIVMAEISESIGVEHSEAILMEDLWLEHSRKMLQLSPFSELSVIKDSSHSMHETNPDAIIKAVREIIDSIN
jgi:pimeloyl-ACP methyl ester carboxylesterase